MLRYLITDTGEINAFAGADSYVIATDHPRYNVLVQALRDNDEETFVQFAEFKRAIEDCSFGQVTVRENQFYYNDELINDALVQHTMSMMEKGFRFEPMFRFIENAYQNPSPRAREELWPFMIRKEHFYPLPITEDGYLLAYKRVTDEYKDFHTETYDNSVGCKLSIDRDLVDDDFGKACSEGFHVGSLAYVSKFWRKKGHIMVVKVDPRDIVSVPTEKNCTKCRCCAYEVIAEYEGELVEPVYSPKGQQSVLFEVSISDDDQYDEEYEHDCK